jgi:hypothetical protein
LFLEDSLRTGVQPQAAQALVPDILETFGGDGGDAGAPARFAAGMTGANLGARRVAAVGARDVRGFPASLQLWQLNFRTGTNSADQSSNHMQCPHCKFLPTDYHLHPIPLLEASVPHPSSCPQKHPFTATFVAFASKFDFSSHATLLDIGGSAGTLSCAVAAAQPHMRCVSADLPVLRGAATAEVARWGLGGGRVRFEALDFFAEAPFPAADVITMSMILHDCESLATAGPAPPLGSFACGLSCRGLTCVAKQNPACRPTGLACWLG